MPQLRYLGRLISSRGHIFIISLALAYASLGLLPANNSSQSTNRSAAPPHGQIISEASAGSTTASSGASTSTSDLADENAPSAPVEAQGVARQSISTSTSSIFTDTAPAISDLIPTSTPPVACTACSKAVGCASLCDDPIDPPYYPGCAPCGSNDPRPTTKYPHLECPMNCAY